MIAEHVAEAWSIISDPECCLNEVDLSKYLKEIGLSSMKGLSMVINDEDIMNAILKHFKVVPLKMLR